MHQFPYYFFERFRKNSVSTVSSSGIICAAFHGCSQDETKYSMYTETLNKTCPEMFTSFDFTWTQTVVHSWVD